jgi:NADPH:quinone reductase-like Zn-dependent oxidoreductase
VLVVADNHARPTPRSGQLLLRVLATYVNPVDVKFRKHPILRCDRFRSVLKGKTRGG